jgi:HEPN domain-containing protein
MKNPEEWLKQADYDMDTAVYMFDGGRYFYAVFMVHLSIEKALKAKYSKKYDQTPPKSHNLIYFIEKNEIFPDENLNRFIIELNNACAATRYPDEISDLQSIFSSAKTKEILSKGKELLKWIKTQL